MHLLYIMIISRYWLLIYGFWPFVMIWKLLPLFYLLIGWVRRLVLGLSPAILPDCDLRWQRWCDRCGVAQIRPFLCRWVYETSWCAVHPWRGIILCNLVNAIQPGLVRTETFCDHIRLTLWKVWIPRIECSWASHFVERTVNQQNVPFKQMETWSESNNTVRILLHSW